MKLRLLCVLCSIVCLTVPAPADEKPVPLGAKSPPMRQISPQMQPLGSRTIAEVTTVPFQKKSSTATRLAQAPAVREEITPDGAKPPLPPLSTLRATFSGPMGTHMLHGDEGGVAMYTLDCEKLMTILEPFERRADGFDLYRTRGNPAFLWAFAKCPDACGRYAVYYNRGGAPGGWKLLHDATRETPTRIGAE